MREMVSCVSEHVMLDGTILGSCNEEPMDMPHVPLLSFSMH